MVLPRLEELQRALGYAFRDTKLAERALTHSSALGHAVSQKSPRETGDKEIADRGEGDRDKRDNEQLEYLGDALLGFLVAEYLVARFPDWTEGQLSKSRSRLVSTVPLSLAAKRLGLGDHLRLGRGEEKTGGRQKPALLADTFEAVVAAIYLDAGLPAARDFAARTLLDAAVQTEGSRLDLSDHKSALQELLQGRGLPPASYQVVRQEGPDHRKTFWVELHVAEIVSAAGSGASKKEAEQLAAGQALEKLRAVPSTTVKTGPTEKAGKARETQHHV
jgi:ribonuclease-3